MFALKFPASEIVQWAVRYSAADDDRVENEVAPLVRTRGYCTRPEFLDLCHWKSPRSKHNVEKNTDSFIEEVTRTALSTPDEQLRIEVLTLLKGVSWPTASVILHLCHASTYPILDFRALWSLSAESTARYDFAFWWGYTDFCRKLAKDHGVSMRVLDRALWQYSKENQPGRE